MKVLWIVNIEVSGASAAWGRTGSPYGGWLDASLAALAQRKDVTVHVLFPCKRAATGSVRTSGGITFQPFKPIRDTDGAESESVLEFESAITAACADIVHVHGTEMAHSFWAVYACNRARIPHVVSVQGLVSTFGAHLDTGLPAPVAYRRTARNILKRDSVADLRRTYLRRGERETKLIRESRFVIGRTEWDEAVVRMINPGVVYFKLPELMRSAFYGAQWEESRCRKHSILVTQSHYPIKGMHLLIKALPALISQYPDLNLVVAGRRPFEEGPLARFRSTGYGLYLKSLVGHLGVGDHVEWVGELTEAEMVERMLDANVLVSPSLVENSSNSISEAKLLGLPVVASYAGGTPSLVSHGVEGFLYQPDAWYLICHFVGRVFSDPLVAAGISARSRKSALEDHDRTEGTARLMAVYSDVLARSEPRA